MHGQNHIKFTFTVAGCLWPARLTSETSQCAVSTMFIGCGVCPWTISSTIFKYVGTGQRS